MIRFERVYLISVITLALAGCAHKPEPVLITKEVLVPVRQACQAKVDPVELEKPASDDIFDLSKAAAIRLRQLVQENRSLRAALNGCR